MVTVGADGVFALEQPTSTATRIGTERTSARYRTRRAEGEAGHGSANLLLDYETNCDVEDLSRPLSHASLVARFLGEP